LSERERKPLTRLASQPRRKAEFIEPMDCAPVTKLIDVPGWVYESLGSVPFGNANLRSVPKRTVLRNA